MDICRMIGAFVYRALPIMNRLNSLPRPFLAHEPLGISFTDVEGDESQGSTGYIGMRIVDAMSVTLMIIRIRIVPMIGAITKSKFVLHSLIGIKLAAVEVLANPDDRNETLNLDFHGIERKDREKHEG
jgi:hypothetical protein